jgi:hypothetical protein
LVPVTRGTDRPDAVPIAKETLARAMNSVGPDGIGSIESRMAANKDVEDRIARGGGSEPRSRPEGSQYPVRLCTSHCEFRVGAGPGCQFFKAAVKESRRLDGEQCELDLDSLKAVELAYRDGDEAAIRAIAGRMSGAVFIEIRKLLDTIIADGACVEEPIFDAKGFPITKDEIARDEHGRVLLDGKKQAIVLHVPLMRKKEHPLYPRLTMLLKETRLIDPSQFLLTPKSSGTPQKTDGMILIEASGGGEKQTIIAVQGQLAARMAEMRERIALAAEARKQDPVFQEMTGAKRPALEKGE